MKVAVTGASGFLGRYALRALVAQGHEVLAVGRSVVAGASDLTYVKTDLVTDNCSGWLKAFKPTHLLHLAWYAEHGKFWSSPANVAWCDTTVRLASSFCENGGKRIVIAGSCAEYDWNFGYCKESSTPTNPATLYGVAKDSARRLTEKVCAAAGVSFAWGRVFIPFGAGEDRRRIVPSVIDALLGRRALFEISTGDWRDFMPVENVADALVCLLEGEASGAFNVCSGVPVQLAQVIRCIGSELGRDPEPLLAKSIERLDAPKFLVGDNKALLDAGWVSKLDVWVALQRYATILAETPDVTKTS